MFDIYYEMLFGSPQLKVLKPRWNRVIHEAKRSSNHLFYCFFVQVIGEDSFAILCVDKGLFALIQKLQGSWCIICSQFGENR